MSTPVWAAVGVACAPVSAGSTATVWDGGALDTATAAEDAGTAADTAAAAGADVAAVAFELPPGPVVELRANKDYVGAALAVIQSAKSQLDITAFETSNGSYLATILGAIKAAAARGVQVRVLLDDEIPNNATVMAELRAAAVDAKLDGAKVRTHVKLMRSEQGFVVGSTNLSQSSLQYNNETNFLVRDATANALMAQYFAALWKSPTTLKKVATAADPNVAVYSDGGYRGVVQPLIQAAQTRILLCTYGMNTDDKDVQAVLADVGAAVKRGVQVRAVLDQSPADFGGDPTINADAGKYLKTLGVSVRVDANTVITHAKFIVVDGTVVLGSNNWGYGGFNGYHEAGVRTSLGSAVAAVVAYWDKLWAASTAL